MPLTLPEARAPFITLFDETYDQPDCRHYYRMLGSLGYSNQAHAVSGCCQTNSNSSQVGQGSCPLCHAKTAPLGESGGAVKLEI